MAASVLAGLATLSGPLHGGAAASVHLLAANARELGAAAAVNAWLAQGRALPAFGHPLYAEGDPRARALLERVPLGPVFADLRQAGEAVTGEPANVDFALAALADAYGLPPGAPFVVFAIARSVGWIGHALEQGESGTLIRPRARYVGPRVGAE